MYADIRLHIPVPQRNARYAVESLKFPRLTANLTGIMGGHYTQADVRGIVAYAADRGIRVIPEADLPGHSQGMQGLSGHGLVFCANGSTTTGVPYADLRNDAEGSTIATLKTMYRELAALFPDEELFIGGDETRPNGPCDLDNYEAIEHVRASNTPFCVCVCIYIYVCISKQNSSRVPSSL